MTNKKKEENKATWLDWVKFIVVTGLYILFLAWLGSWWGLVVVPFIFDAYITKKIPWTWWKKSTNPIVRSVMSWVDAIVFALVAVYFVNLYFFQNYQIPSSSLEKSLLTGDHLFVSKISYGPRIPNTPVHMPMTSHTIPFLNIKSYLDFPQWAYRRVQGLGNVKQNDIVVFNYPSGDTIVSNLQDMDYYTLCYELGEQLYPFNYEGLSDEEKLKTFEMQYSVGRNYIQANPDRFGEILQRPIDMRECYVKRCVGIPGQWLRIKDGIVYTDGKPNKQPDNAQQNYEVDLKYDIPEDFCKEYGITREDRTQAYGETAYRQCMPLTKRTLKALSEKTDMVNSIQQAIPTGGLALYPHNMQTGWTCNDYGPIWIPQKGKTARISLRNLPIYQRIIEVYENNKLEVKDGQIWINGKQTDLYTFKMDYYWMMGDNRDNSADSRFWGFVPEDHIVGKPIFIWLSLNKDYGLFNGKIRWNRFFKMVDDIK